MLHNNATCQTILHWEALLLTVRFLLFFDLGRYMILDTLSKKYKSLF